MYLIFVITRDCVSFRNEERHHFQILLLLLLTSAKKPQIDIRYGMEFRLLNTAVSKAKLKFEYCNLEYVK